MSKTTLVEDDSAEDYDPNNPAREDYEEELNKYDEDLYVDSLLEDDRRENGQRDDPDDRMSQNSTSR